MTMVHVSEFRVRYSETDQMGVVYHAEYLVWCEVGRTDFIRALGLPYAELERRGTALAVAEAIMNMSSTIPSQIGAPAPAKESYVRRHFRPCPTQLLAACGSSSVCVGRCMFS